MKALVLIAVGALVLARRPARSVALAGSKPGTGTSGQGGRGRTSWRQLRRELPLQHRAPDDPIVFPGKPGASHEHTFVGNRTTGAFSTYGSLRSGRRPAAHRRHGRVLGADALPGNDRVLPSGHDLLPAWDVRRVSTFPNNLRMIAGDAAATAPQGMRVTSGAAERAVVDRSAPCRHVRTGGSFLRLHVRFPSAGTAATRQRGPQEPHGVRDRGLPVDASGRGAGDHPDLPLPDAGRRGFLARLERQSLARTPTPSTPGGRGR